MAYSQNNLSRIALGLLDGSWNMWVYRSTDDFATVKAADYLANAYEMGVRAGDAIFVVDSNASPPTVTLAAIATCTNAPACTMAQTGVVPST